MQNDLESVTVGEYPELEEIRTQLLNEGAERAMMNPPVARVKGPRKILAAMA